MANRAKWQNTIFHVGDTVEIDYLIKEKNKTRVQPYRGIVISIRGSGESKTFTVGKRAVNGVWVERIFPLNSPWIANLKVVHRPRKRVRRAKLYYLRQLHGKKAQL